MNVSGLVYQFVYGEAEEEKEFGKKEREKEEEEEEEDLFQLQSRNVQRDLDAEDSVRYAVSESELEKWEDREVCVRSVVLSHRSGK